MSSIDKTTLVGQSSASEQGLISSALEKAHELKEAITHTAHDVKEAVQHIVHNDSPSASSTPTSSSSSKKTPPPGHDDTAYAREKLRDATPAAKEEKACDVVNGVIYHGRRGDLANQERSSSGSCQKCATSHDDTAYAREKLRDARPAAKEEKASDVINGVIYHGRRGDLANQEQTQRLRKAAL
jgi:hypothetical protein